MANTDFVKSGSIVRKIWGDLDMIFFIFAGAAAEFSLNKAVDWLYFTGKLPSDPLGRLFSTVAYARKIVFSSEEDAHLAIDQIAAIHKQVELKRATQIPDWAFRDVLFMLIGYSMRAFEVLERKLTTEEKEEIFVTFQRVGQRMQISGLPATLVEWEVMHQAQLSQNLVYSKFSANLFVQYKKNLGPLRYQLMRHIQAIVVPKQVNFWLKLGSGKQIAPILAIYKLTRSLNFNAYLRNLLLPLQYKSQLLALAG
ncbi:MAG: oxygenase MpaB family protein [Pedobacter sp.]|nr:oxygenase MpaB family protein [Pedobacter sp.]MDQ8051709.1 oxygenase MpaB family protein [Pedobacter sp.]